jgi:hypothetical protein
MIYITPFDPLTKEALGDSADSGFVNLADVEVCMGAPLASGKRWATYPDGVAFSDFPFRLTGSSDSGYHAST